MSDEIDDHEKLDQIRGVTMDYMGGRPVHECMDEIITILQPES